MFWICEIDILSFTYKFLSSYFLLNPLWRNSLFVLSEGTPTLQALRAFAAYPHVAPCALSWLRAQFSHGDTPTRKVSGLRHPSINILGLCHETSMSLITRTYTHSHEIKLKTYEWEQGQDLASASLMLWKCRSRPPFYQLEPTVR